MIYNQTVQLVIFLPIFTTSCMGLKIDVTERSEKILTFGVHLNKALVYISPKIEVKLS
jgi:hypothetical protein